MAHAGSDALSALGCRKIRKGSKGQRGDEDGKHHLLWLVKFTGFEYLQGGLREYRQDDGGGFESRRCCAHVPSARLAVDGRIATIPYTERKQRREQQNNDRLY